MQLRRRLQSKPETISDFYLAADQKYWEGMELGTAGRFAAGIYLLGYAAEMHLKVAAFRFDGANTGDLVSVRLGPARSWMLRQSASVNHEGYHSLMFWMEYVRRRRAASGQSLSKTMDGLLAHHVARIYSLWWVEMRYRPDEASAGELERLLKDVSWVRENQNSLWRS
jgi:hypothetical protein